MIPYCAGILFLAVLAAEDIRKKEIPVSVILIFAFGAILFKVFSKHFFWSEVVLCLVPGGFFLLLSLITKESIGYGDGMTVLVLGLWTGGWFTVLSAAMGIILSGIYGGCCVLFQKKDPIPFIPFLLLGMEVVLAYA